MEKENETIILPEKADNMSSFETYYDENDFWNKIRSIAKKVGASILRPVLLLHYVLNEGKVPMKTKAYIIGALGYFILPTDIIPDFIVGLGYTDDLAVIALLLKQVNDNITPEIESKTDKKLRELLK